MLRFIWDYANLTHIAEHDVTPQEVEEVLNGDTLDLEYQVRHAEERFKEIGVTASGRFLEVITTWRDGIRVVTAYDATKIAIEAYLESR